MFCSQCGKEIPNGSIFCPECGSQVATAVQPSNNATTNGTTATQDVSLQSISQTVSKKTVKKPLLIAVIAVVALVAIATALIYVKQAPEVEYQKNMVALCNEIRDTWDTGSNFVDDTVTKYKNFTQYAYEELDWVYPLSDSRVGTLLIETLYNDKKDGGKIGTAFYKQLDDLNTKAEKIDADFKALSNPPKRYQAAYEQLREIYDNFNIFHLSYLDDYFYTQINYNKLASSWNNDKKIAVKQNENLSTLVTSLPKPISIQTLINSSDERKIEENLSTATTIYNAANTYITNTKASTGIYPTISGLADLLNEGDIKIDIPSKKSVAINYNSSTGTIDNVWVCSSKKGITGTNKDKALACYDPYISGNAADTTNFDANLFYINGKWQLH
jgi:hypothetical protein